MPATSPAVAGDVPRRSPFEARIRFKAVSAVQMAKGATSPNGRLSNPRTSALVADRSLKLPCPVRP